MLHYCTLPLVEFLLFPTMSLLVETVVPIRTFVTVRLVVIFAVDILEWMRARLAILCSESWRIRLIVLFVAPWFFPVMLGFVRTIAYNTPGHMWSTPERWMAPFTTVLILWNTWADTSAMDSSNKSTNVKVTVDNAFCFRTWLRILDVNPNDS